VGPGWVTCAWITGRFFASGAKNLPMCGIAAVVGRELPDIATADAARDTMTHRGPDDRGSWRSEHVWLASRRLAVIDTSAEGHQPLHDPQSGATVAFNGEIFNHVELRAELEALGHRFRSHSDTEVLLHAFLQWGEDCVTRFNGMWAFAIWDPREHALFLSRDRFGVKPLFMASVDGGLALASEPKVLLALYPQLARPDERSLADLLARKRVATGRGSFYAGIESVPAGHCGWYRVGDRAPRLRRFWDFPAADEVAELSPGEVDERFGAVFDDAARLRLRSDVPVGLTLSGGLDSTAVLHAAWTGLGDGEHALRAYTSVYDVDPAFNELAYARRAAARYPGVELVEVPAEVDDWLGVLRQIVWHMDGPGFSPAVFPLWQIMAAARRDGVVVLLEGQGADELLGGYATHYAAALAGVRRPGDVVTMLRGGARSFGLRRLAAESAIRSIAAARRFDQRRSTVAAALSDDLRALDGGGGARSFPGRDALDTRLLETFTTDLLPGFLHYGDAISMAHSVESRLPFLDYRLVELCFTLPAREKIGGGETKAVLRRYLHRAGQSAVAGRARKVGYSTPTNVWLAADDGALLRDTLLAPNARVAPYVDRARLSRVIDRHVGGAHSAGDVLFALLCTELWLDECVAGAAGAAALRPAA
jgi:asparagine synthase (glutamine-hydrolysing)